MSEPRGMAQAERALGERERAIWSFFEVYKTAGKGRATARPDMGTFLHVNEETRQKDQQLLAFKKNRPALREQRESGPDAFAFENYLTTQAGKYCWFGGELSPTTEFDDWISGADAVVEWPGDGEPIRLAIDFTSTQDANILSRKSDKLEGNVKLKYLRSKVEEEDGRPRELRASMPIVLLGFDESVYRAIAQSEVSPPEELHPLRRLLVEQAASQVDFQLKLLSEKVFESPRARRAKNLMSVREKYFTLSDKSSAEQVRDFFLRLEPSEIDALLNEKMKIRLRDLIRLKDRLAVELQRSQGIALDGGWQEVANQSKTHQMLSG